MKGVTFGTQHSYNNFSLILSKKTIGSPKPRIKNVEVPESDGYIDLTEYFGEVKYDNRSLKFVFSVVNGSYESAYSALMNAIHGKSMKITLDDDPNYYYIGRVMINEWTSNPVLQTIEVECDCEPYKYKEYETIIRESIIESKMVGLNNWKKKVVPTFITSATFTIQFGTISVTQSAGTFIIPSIILEEGSHVITFTGTGTVTIKYQEKGL